MEKIMKEFKFEMNGYKNVCYVFRDLEREPVDTLSLIETKNDFPSAVFMHHFILPSPKSDSQPSLKFGSMCDNSQNAAIPLA
jgi:hypothetical protein